MSILLMLLGMSFARAFEARAPEQILHLAIRCEGSAVAHDYEAVTRALKRHNRGAQIHLVEMNWPCGADDEAIASAVDALTNKLAAIVREVETFELVALDFPEAGSAAPTVVRAFNFDAELGTAMSPLHERVEKNGKILLMTGNAFTEDEAWNRSRAVDLMNYLGATEGKVFGLNTPKQLFERFNLKNDVRLSTLVSAVTFAFTMALWTQPTFTWKAIGLSLIYSWGAGFLHKMLGGTLPEPKELDVGHVPTLAESKAEYDDYTTSQSLHDSMPGFLGDLLAAYQFLDPSAYPALGDSWATQVAILVPVFYGLRFLGRRSAWYLQNRFEQINVGRMVKRGAGGILESVKLRIYKDSAAIFSCEDNLTQSSTPPVDAAA